MNKQEFNQFILIVNSFNMTWYTDYIVKNENHFKARFRTFQHKYEDSVKIIERHLCPATVTMSDINDTYPSTPWKTEAFIQSIASGISPSFLVMAWLMIYLEADLLELSVQYKARSEYCIGTTIRIPYSELTLNFASEEIDDGVILRHLSSVKADGFPLYSGYHAFRTPKDP